MDGKTQGGTTRLPETFSSRDERIILRAAMTAAQKGITRLSGDAELLAVVAIFRVQMHEDAILENWRVFHGYPPTDKHSYVYRYYGAGGENLIYVGMTSNAVRRAVGSDGHWKKSEWWSWVDSVEYKRCRNRDAAYKLESKIRREEKPLWDWKGGHAETMRQIDEEFRFNHVLGICDCLDRSTDAAYLERYSAVPAAG
jgi:hypothetical protein